MKSLSAPEGPPVKMEHLDRYFTGRRNQPIEILVPSGSLSKGPQMKEASTRVQNPSTPPSSRLREMSSLCRPPNTNVSSLLTVRGNEDTFKVKSTRVFFCKLKQPRCSDLSQRSRNKQWRRCQKCQIGSAIIPPA